MIPQEKVKIRLVRTGVAGLDEILGGGMPEMSFNIIAGEPGSGKTTLAHQVAFANATAERPALYFTILGEPALKMLRYQQQHTFFDIAKLNTCVKFINLSTILLEHGMTGVMQEITREVEANNPGIVVVDSFRSLVRQAKGIEDESQIQGFLQVLGELLTSFAATTFLLGEYGEEIRHGAVFTIADGVLWLRQHVEGNSVVRKLQVLKLRGQETVPGLHTFRITDAGLQAFSRTLGLGSRQARVRRTNRLSMGVPKLDEMLGGGIPEGNSVLIVGSAGTGKSLLATQFIAAGLREGQPGIIAVFEERPLEYAERATNFGIDLNTPLKDGSLRVIYLRPLDLSVDETMQELMDCIRTTGAKRLVIDSLAGFEMALAPGFRADFRESLYRMIFSLNGIGITVLSTVETEESFTQLPLTTYSVSFLTDDIIRLRYVEIGGYLRKIMMIIKMRGSNHSREIHEYEVTPQGIVIGDRITGYDHVITGIPTRERKS